MDVKTFLNSGLSDKGTMLEDIKYDLNENLSNLWDKMHENKIKDEFNLIPIKNGCWADAYNDGRRRVISLFHLNTSFATFKWGWNFEYIPHYTSKITWCRTDKSIYTHTFELSPKFINRKENNYTVFGKFKSKFLTLII